LKLAGPGKEMQAFEKQGNSVSSSSTQTAAGVSRFPASILAAFCRNGRPALRRPGATPREPRQDARAAPRESSPVPGTSNQVAKSFAGRS